MPPLHANMVRRQWTDDFSHAFDHLQQQLGRSNINPRSALIEPPLHLAYREPGHQGKTDRPQQHRPDINSCAATAPAVFFAVVSEYFFSDPNTLRHHSSAAYDQRVLFDRQDPASRQAESGSSSGSGQI